MTGNDIDHSQAVHSVWPVPESTELGETACAFCDEELTPGEAWRVTLERSGIVVTCTPCAARSRKEGDLSWLGGEQAGVDEGLMANTDEIKRELVAAYAHLYEVSDIYEAGITDALDRVTQELEQPSLEQLSLEQPDEES